MWSNSQEADLITGKLRLNNNHERSASCGTSSGKFSYAVPPNHVDSQSSMRLGADDTAGLDEVLDNVNRLLASLNDELDDACSDDENKSDVSSSGDVDPSHSASLISQVRAKTTPLVAALNEDDAKAGADKQDFEKPGDKGRVREKKENEPIELQSRSDECPSNFLLERKLNFHSSLQENGLKDSITSKQWTTKLPYVNSVAHKNDSGRDIDISTTISVEEKPRLLPKAKSQGALCIGSLNLAKSVACNDLKRFDHSVSVDRSSPVISRHQSFQAYKSSRGNLNCQENDFAEQKSESASHRNHEEDLSPSPRRKSKQKALDRIESWFTAQQDATSTEDAEPVKQTKRFSSLTHSAPFKFAQQLIPGSREKRKLTGTKSLPVTRKSLKLTRKQRPPIIDPTEVILSHSLDITTPEKETSSTKEVGCLLIDDEEGQVGQKPPTGIPGDSAASGNWVKQKFSTINKSFLQNFRRSISLEEANRKSMRTSADKRSPNQEGSHWGTETPPQTLTRHGTPDTERQPLAMDNMGPNHVRRCNDESIMSTTGRNGMANYNGDQRYSPLFFLFDSESTQLPSRRATMDSTKIPKRKNTSFCHNVNVNLPFKEPFSNTDSSPLSRDGSYGTTLKHSHLSFPNTMWDSGASSEESIGSETKVKRHHSDRYLKKQAAFDNFDDTARNPALKKGPIDKIRKSLKHVGKTSSSPIPGSDEMAERTWGPNGNCTWSNMSGRKMQLGSTRLQSLSELECDALQKVAIQRLTESDLGVAVVVPKDDSKVINRKISMRKKYAVHLSARDKNKEKGCDRVFGIPLLEVVENDQLLRLQKSAAFATTLDFSVANDGGAVNEEIPPQQSGGSCSSSCSGSVASINQQQQNLQVASERPCIHKCIQKASSCESLNVQEYTTADRDSVFSNPTTPSNDGSQASANSNTSSAARPLKRRGAIAADSLNEIDPYQSQLLEALSLSVSGKTHNHRREKKRSLLPPTMAQVPYVVQKCCDHITKYGLDVTGIFRVAGSKKRVKQLREEFDRGFDVTIDEDYNPHDVAALLKEFIRDLPEALLTRELYHAFIQTAKLPKSERLPTLRSLVWLLPLTNRDTLYTLLSFLAVVAAHSEDSVDSTGKKVPGNKMSVSNLATIFGPNILHRYKKSPQTGNDNQYQVQSLEKAEDSSAVITVVEEIISNHTQLFQIVKYDHDQMLRTLNDTDPEAVDFLLRRKAANYMREKSKLLTNQSKPKGHHNTSSMPPSSGNNHFNNSNNNNNRVELATNGNCGPKLTDVTEYCSCEENGNNSADDNAAEQKQHSTMRLSYQQATGHVPVTPKRDSTEKGGKLKFKRPFFKRSNRPPASGSDLDEQNEGSNNSSGCDDVGKSEADDKLTMLERGQSFEKERITGDVSSSSMWSLGNSEAAAGMRSMSFTEDDLHDILQPSDRASPQSSRSNASITPQLESEKSQSAHSSIPDLFDDHVFNEGKVNHDEVSVTQSSDSGVCVDNFCFSPRPSKDVVKRRGGFSLKQTVESTPNQTEVEGVRRNSDLASVNDSKSASTDSLLSTDEDSTVLTTGPSNTAVCPPYKEAPVFTSKMSVKFTANLSNNNNNNNNNNSTNVGTAIHATQFVRRSSQVIRLCDNNTNTTVAEQQDASTTYETKRSEASNYSESKIQPTAQGSNLRTRNRLPSSLSPRLQRQYGASATGSTPVRTRTRVRANNVNNGEGFNEKEVDDIVGKRIRNTNGLNREQKQQSQYMGETILAETVPTIENASISLKATTHRPTQQYTPNAANPSAYRTRYGRRYSKDDLSISSKPNSSVSKWTASGLIPRNINLNSSYNGGQFIADRSANHLQSVRDDQSRLPETWV